MSERDPLAPCPRCGYYLDTPNHVYGCAADTPPPSQPSADAPKPPVPTSCFVCIKGRHAECVRDREGDWWCQCADPSHTTAQGHVQSCMAKRFDDGVCTCSTAPLSDDPAQVQP